MKKKVLSPTVRKVLLAIGCLLLAIVFWFAVKYIEADFEPIITFGLG